MQSGGLEILSQVMLSLKVKQTKSMNNIKALIANSAREIDVIDKIEDELGILAGVEAKMHQCEGFMLQLASSRLKEDADNKSEENQDKDSEK